MKDMFPRKPIIIFELHLKLLLLIFFKLNELTIRNIMQLKGKQNEFGYHPYP